MELEIKTSTVADVVRKDYRTAKVFKKYRIDFCCEGGKTIDQVCIERKIEPKELRNDLDSILAEEAPKMIAFDTWPLDQLIDHIEKKHHRYIEETAPLLKQYLKKVDAVHSNGAPYLTELYRVFDESAGNLAVHMKKEELILFPFIKGMVEAEKNGTPFTPPPFGSVGNPIDMMQAEHDAEGEHFRYMEELSNGYEIPNWACNTFIVAIKMLREFQDDLHAHIHLENNILFPKALELESHVLSPA